MPSYTRTYKKPNRRRSYKGVTPYMLMKKISQKSLKSKSPKPQDRGKSVYKEQRPMRYMGKNTTKVVSRKDPKESVKKVIKIE